MKFFARKSWLPLTSLNATLLAILFFARNMGLSWPHLT
jgi:hypothetical protein